MYVCRTDMLCMDILDACDIYVKGASGYVRTRYGHEKKFIPTSATVVTLDPVVAGREVTLSYERIRNRLAKAFHEGLATWRKYGPGYPVPMAGGIFYHVEYASNCSMIRPELIESVEDQDYTWIVNGKYPVDKHNAGKDTGVDTAMRRVMDNLRLARVLHDKRDWYLGKIRNNKFNL